MRRLESSAEAFARKRHAGQLRKGAAREPYVVHLEEVAGLVKRAGGDAIAVAAAWLHDTVEDVGVTYKKLEKRFGEAVAAIVRELSDDKTLPKKKRKLLQIKNAPRKSARAAMINVADKTSNLRSIAASPPVGWNAARRAAYAAWADKVVRALPEAPEPLMIAFRTAHDAMTIGEAAALAAERHKGKARLGPIPAPYVTHCAEVAELVAAYGGTAETIAAAWLHDTVEDTKTTFSEIAKVFGVDVAALVKEVTDDPNLSKKKQRAAQIASAPSKSPGAALIKAADQTSNVRSLVASPPKWSAKKRAAYIAKCRAVVAGLHIPNGLRFEFEAAALGASIQSLARNGV